MRKQLSYEIAISGISTALAVSCIVLSFYLPVMTLTFYALSGIVLMLPLIVESLRGVILTFLASAILGFLFTNYIAILPFIFIFGSGTIVMYICEKYFNKKLYFSIPVKIVFINLALFGIYSLMGFEQIAGVLARIGINAMYIWIALIATTIYLAYDFLLQKILHYLKRRMSKLLKNRINNDKNIGNGDPDDNDPFDN
ncbi:MAG: hypothetical protein EOM87_03780 [Clostridia bacterium]|nr:hypothetical protein [Clostridia bacterium]